MPLQFIFNTVQSVAHESHNPFLRKRPKSYKEKSKNGIPMVSAVVTHRRQDGDPLAYEQHHMRLQGYISSKVVQKGEEDSQNLMQATVLISELIEKLKIHSIIS